MSGDISAKKIRFTTPAQVLFSSENKIEDLEYDSDPAKKEKTTPTLVSFLQVELTRNYVLEHDEERFSARREKVYSFMRIPREVERFMRYGFMQCTDSFLFVYTFLPMRVVLVLWALMIRAFSRCFWWRNRVKQKLTPAEICDLLKAVIVVVCSMFMFSIDTNMLYHLIKTQSVIKLYIFFNLLEVGDRLFSAFGQDTIDALFWTATEPRGRKREHLGVLAHLIFAMVYVVLHSILVLFQAATLNVAFNSNNKALLIIMMSNNFLEIKGSVFKKFDKNNLFQVSCSDVRERFHLAVLLSIVILQTMREYSWKSDRFWVLLPDSLLVLISEIFVDWVKHAFITRFNDLNLDVYRDYTISLAYDVAQTRQKYAFSDHSDLVARRMGFIPLPLGVVMIRVLLSAIPINDFSSVILFFLAYLCLASFKILNNIVILGHACDLIFQHKQEKASIDSPANVKSQKDTATSPLRPPVAEQPNGFPKMDLGAAPIFANSTVDLKNVSLNEELLKVEGEDIKIEPAEITRSFPDIIIKQEEGDFNPDELKRAESEPSLNTCNAEDSDSPPK